MTLTETLLGALLLAFAGAGHCVGMCGAISMNMTFAVPESQRQGWQLSLWHALYSAGRVSSYVLLGALVGFGGDGLMQQLPGGQQLPWLLAAAVMILIALYLAGKEAGIRLIERAGLVLWRRIQPLMKPLLPVRHAGQAWLVGMLWGLMPCGLVYSALALATVSGGAVQGALTLLVFGLVTIVPVAGTGILGGRFQAARRPLFRRVGALMALIFALWLLSHAWPRQGGHHHHGHGASPAESTPASGPENPAETHQNEAHQGHSHHH